MYDANRFSVISELKDTRDRLYDVAKGVGIILVICGHMFYNGWCEYPRRIIYLFHMPLFFFISGAFLGRVLTRRFKDECYKLAVNVAVPFVFFFAIGTVLKFFHLHPFPWPRFLSSLWAGHPCTNPPLWFLTVIICSRMLINRCPIVVSKWWGWVVALMVSIVVFLLPKSILRVLPLKMGLWPIAILYMGLGFKGKDFLCRIREKNLRSVILVVIAVFCLLFPCIKAFYFTEYVSLSSYDFGDVTNILAAVAGIGGIMAFAEVLTRTPLCGVREFLIYLGRNALYIFSFEATLSGVEKLALARFGIDHKHFWFFFLHMANICIFLLPLRGCCRWMSKKFDQTFYGVAKGG